MLANPMASNPMYGGKNKGRKKMKEREEIEESDFDTKSQPGTVKEDARGKEFSSDSEVISFKRRNKKVGRRRRRKVNNSK